MTEHEMEDLLWEHPEKLLNEQLEQFQRQPSSTVGRADLVFRDRIGRLLVVELKRDTLERGAIPQLIDYFGMIKLRFPDTPIELMIVANHIPMERRLACNKFDIGAVEISQKKFRNVAEEVGYVFKSEAVKSTMPSNAGFATLGEPRQVMRAAVPGGRSRTRSKVKKAWFYWQDSSGHGYFLAFVNARGSCSMRTFDGTNGAYIRIDRNRSVDYEEAFAEYLKSAVSLHISRQPNLEHNCKDELPPHILSELRQQMPS